MDTIFALASAAGKAGVAVVRISGPAAKSGAERLTGPLPEGGRALRSVRGQDRQLIDQALVLTFQEGSSFTDEEVVELHLHGSPAITAAVLRDLGEIDGFRLALPGEFTRRALESGRLDLAQVEGLSDLIEAETEAQRRQAMRVFSGALGDKAGQWREKLIRAASLLEVTIDFSDEDVPIDVMPDVLGYLRSVRHEMEKELAGISVAERIRDGFEVAIVGAPNVGKSTLLNRMAGRDAAITSSIAGTTRDVIEVRMDLNGLPVTFLDTAGLRDSDDAIEVIGVARARERAARADLRIYLLCIGDEVALDLDEDDIIVEAKGDLATGQKFSVSGLTGEGVDALIEMVTGKLAARTASVGVAMKERHRVALDRAVLYLEGAERAILAESSMADLIAEEVRSAIRAVDSLVGRVDVDDLLDEIFSRFCIGK